MIQRVKVGVFGFLLFFAEIGASLSDDSARIRGEIPIAKLFVVFGYSVAFLAVMTASHAPELF